MLARIIVVRVNLHRELVFREKEFREQRELAAACPSACPPTQAASCATPRRACGPDVRRRSYTWHAMPVSHTSPIGVSAELCREPLSGNNGASDLRSPDAGNETGSSSAGLSFTTPTQRRKKTFHPANAFVNALNRGGIRDAQVAGRAKRFSGDHRHMRALQQLLAQAWWYPRRGQAGRDAWTRLEKRRKRLAAPCR